MKNLIAAYTHSDGNEHVVYGADKATLEKQFGKMSDAEYVAMVLGKSIPRGASNVREITREEWVSIRAKRPVRTPAQRPPVP